MLDFDGADDMVTVSTFAVPTTGSVSFWWKADENVDDYAGINHSIFQIFRTSPELQIFEIFIYSDGSMYSGWYTASSGDTRHRWVVTGLGQTWHHFVYRWTDATSNSLYIDNTNITNLNGTTAPATWDTSAETLRFGYNTTGTSYANMKLTDVRFFNRVISTDEIASLYNEKLKMGGVLASATNYWPMDDREAGTAADSDPVNDIVGGETGTPTYGGNASGMTWGEETILSYPPKTQFS